MIDRIETALTLFAWIIGISGSLPIVFTLYNIGELENDDKVLLWKLIMIVSGCWAWIIAG